MIRAFTLAVCAFMACSPAAEQRQIDNADIEADYIRSQTLCLAAETKPEWKACHCRVDARFGRPCPFNLDGGNDAH